MADIDYRNPTILQVDDAQVSTVSGVQYVDLTAGADGALLAVNNLSDLASASTALANLGGTATGIAVFTAANAADARTAIGVASEVLGPFDFNCDADGTLGLIKFQAPIAGTVTQVRGTLYGTGPSDAGITIDMTIGGVAVTGGGVTFALGANDGAVQNSTATAANVMAAGDVIAIGVTTANTASLRGTFSILYTRA